MLVNGERVGTFIVLRDITGRRHALRSNAIVGISDSDDLQDETVLTIQGGRTLLVRASMDEVLAWFT